MRKHRAATTFLVFVPETGEPTLLPLPTGQLPTARRDDTRFPSTWSDANWVERTHAAVGELAGLLAIPRDRIEVTAHYTRDYGDWPWPLMTVTDPDGTLHRFTAGYNRTAQLFPLGPCPYCGEQVPLIWIRTLSDYGDLLDGTTLNPDTFDPVPEFHGDPGHTDTRPRPSHR